MQQSEKQALDRKQPWVGQPRGNEDDEINLVELLYRLIEKWKIIALASLLGALIAAVYTFCFITPMYTATSKLYVVNTKDSAINLSDLQIGNYLASDYTEVFSNWHVHEMTGLHVQPAGRDGFCEKPEGHAHSVCQCCL